MRDTISETAPSDHEILQRLQRTHLRGGSRKILGKRLGSLASGAMIGVFLCGTALPWALSTGRITLPQRAAHSDGEHSDIEHSDSAHIEEKPASSLTTQAGETDTATISDFTGRLNSRPNQSWSSQSDTSNNEAATPQLPSTEAVLRDRNARPARPGSSAPSNDDWIKVAARMREGDYSAARHTLSNMVRAEQPAAREAAEILDIQLRLRMTDGQLTDSDHARLTDLARIGHSPSVRSAAERLLRKYEPARTTKSARDPERAAPMK
jgi:hypothetical protein